MARGNPNPKRENLRPGAGPGRPKGSKNKLTAARVEEELRRIALLDPRELFVRVHGQRTVFTLREIHQMPADVAACISSIKVRTENLTAGDGAQDTTVEIKLWDKVKALELCARYLKMLTDKQEVQLTVDERTARLLAARARAGDVSDT